MKDRKFRKFKEFASTGLVIGGIFFMTWFLPPWLRRVMSLCPLGTDPGIGQAEAIPAFARKYRTSCSTCHSAPPKLNSFGEAFRLNGYQFPVDDEAMVKEEPIPLGSEAHKEMFPKEVWPSFIPPTVPLSVRFFGDAVYSRGNQARTNFDFPSFWRILAGTSLDDHISAFMTICFKTQPTKPTTSVAIPFQAQVIYKDALKGLVGNDRMNFRFGMVALPNLSWNNFFQHLIISNYLYGETTIPGSQNPWAFLTPGGTPTLEIYGLMSRGRLYYSASVNNGGALTVKDDNSGKDVSIVSRYKFGGIPLGGPGVTSGGQSSASGDGRFWETNSVQVGGLWYRGTTTLVKGGVTDRFQRGGLDLRLQHRQERDTPGGAWDLTGAVLWGHNDNPWGTDSAARAFTRSWYTEGTYFLYPWLLPGFRYEEVDVSEAAASLVTAGAPTSVDTNRLILSLTIRQRHNFKWTLEGLLFTKKNGSTEKLGDAHTAVARFDIDF